MALDLFASLRSFPVVTGITSSVDSMAVTVSGLSIDSFRRLLPLYPVLNKVHQLIGECRTYWLEHLVLLRCPLFIAFP